MDWEELLDIIRKAKDEHETYLDLAFRQIDELPREIGELTDLTWLNLSSNRLTSLPSEIGELTNLKLLDLRNNDLGELPGELTYLGKLEALYLNGNPLGIPFEIMLETDPSTLIASYFGYFGEDWEEEERENLVVKRRPLREAKVILVGEGSVGKTSLVNGLLDNSFNPNETKTDGIAISRWYTPAKPRRIRLNIWDFGGQEIYHHTHQFFLTKRSIYLLVLDARISQEQNQVEYWLKLIQSFGVDSPVILVGNKTDQHPLDIDYTGLRKKYPNIVSVVQTSAATGLGISELRQIITQQVDHLPHIRDLLPENWFRLKARLERLSRKRNYITDNDYKILCEENDVRDEISQRTLVGFLHDLGIVLHFQDDPRLKVLGILNPQWVTKGVYRILNSNELFQKKGVLEYKDLGQILSSEAYPPNLYMFIVDIMRKFELCYEFAGDPEPKYLVPDLLPREEPFTGEWKDTLSFEFQYIVLPSSIISRFIVRVHPFIHHNTVWRSGVVIKIRENLALVRADYEDKKVYIRVDGMVETRRDILAIIRSTLEALHKTITGIDVLGKVPHPLHSGLILDYDELIEFEKHEILSFPRKVDNKVVNVDVKKLLDGVEGGKSTQVFISYTHADEKFTKRLVKELLDAGISIWQDKVSLGGGVVWADEIGQGILSTKVFIVILSPDSVTSEMVKKEYTYAITSRRKVIPILYKECELPFLLSNIQYVDFTKDTHKRNFENLKQNIFENLRQ